MVDPFDEGNRRRAANLFSSLVTFTYFSPFSSVLQKVLRGFCDCFFIYFFLFFVCFSFLVVKRSLSLFESLIFVSNRNGISCVDCSL